MEKLKEQPVLDTTKTLEPTKVFGGTSSGILHYDSITHKKFYQYRKDIRGLFWTADEIEMQNDIKQFKHVLTDNEREVFIKSIGLLATLDGPQTDIALHISQYASEKAVRALMATIADQESEHNNSYTYILSSVTDFETTVEAFNLGLTDPLVMERNEDIEQIYNEFAKDKTVENLLYCLVQSSLLEGVYFYSAFTLFYYLAKEGKMVSTSTMINYINRDEMYHGRYIGELFRILLEENPELNNPSVLKRIYDMFKKAYRKESEWARSLLGSIEGIDLTKLDEFLKLRCNKVLALMGLDELFDGVEENPLPWLNLKLDNFSDTKSDFFEQKSRQYVKVNNDNGFDEL